MTRTLKIALLASVALCTSAFTAPTPPVIVHSKLIWSADVQCNGQDQATGITRAWEPVDIYIIASHLTINTSGTVETWMVMSGLSGIYGDPLTGFLSAPATMRDDRMPVGYARLLRAASSDWIDVHIECNGNGSVGAVNMVEYVKADGS
jgi:hypothetical protein